MGIRTFLFLVRNQEELDEVIELVNKHNSAGLEAFNNREVGEELYFVWVITPKDKKQYFVEYYNGGGGEDTASFIRKNYSRPNHVYYPWMKPKWYKDEDYTIIQENKTFNGGEIPIISEW